MIRGSERPPFDRLDLCVGEELANRAALALNILNRLEPQNKVSTLLGLRNRR